MQFKVNDKYYIDTSIYFGGYESGLYYAGMMVCATFDAIEDLDGGILFNDIISKDTGELLYVNGEVVGRRYEGKIAFGYNLSDVIEKARMTRDCIDYMLLQYIYYNVNKRRFNKSQKGIIFTIKKIWIKLKRSLNIKI